MYKKIILILLVIVFLPSCKENASENNAISKATEEILLSRTNGSLEDYPKDEVITDTPSTKPMVAPSSALDEVDKEDANYQIHKGKIDCYNKEDCENIASEITEKYHDIISNVNYLEVKSTNNDILGYYINYTFKPSTFSSYEACISYAEALANDLPNYIENYDCVLKGTLYINKEDSLSD